MPSIRVEIRSVFGRDLIYPVDAAAQVFADLTGTTTLSRWHLSRIESLGFAVEISRPLPDWVSEARAGERESSSDQMRAAIRRLDARVELEI